MAGIVGFGAYVPKYRLGPQTKGWELPGEKAIANFDEDSITMAVAAGMDCLRGRPREAIDALLFATTTPPYLEKQSASTIATALDLSDDLIALDLTGSLRAGTSALQVALDMVRAGSAHLVLLVAADMRMAPPKGEFDRSFGDGAAAFLVGNEQEVAAVEAGLHLSEHMLDIWRSQGDTFVRSWEDRFIIEEGYERILGAAVARFLAQQHLSASEIDRVVLYGPDGRRLQGMGRSLGFSPGQIQDGLFGKLGNTGSAFVPMLLVAALEAASPGQRLLVASYGDGADVYLLRVSDAPVGGPHGRGLGGYLGSKALVDNYDRYIRWRELMPAEAARRPAPAPISISASWRDRDEIIRLYGGRCGSCGTVQYPPQAVCVACQARGSSEPWRLSDRRGTVFTYSMDYLAGTTDVPLVITVVNFEGGGRMLCMMTDREVDQVQVGLPVEMSFRKLRTVGGVHNYYWKSVPLRLPH